MKDKRNVQSLVTRQGACMSVWTRGRGSERRLRACTSARLKVTRNRRPALLVLLGFVLSLGVASWLPVSAQVLPVTLKEMVQSASIIVTGRVVEVREDRHPHYRRVGVTYVTVEVEEMLKGAANGQTRHTFMQFGSMGLTRISELPTYRVGEEVVLFLYPESEYGFTSPVGGGQGKLYLQRDPQTGRRIVSYGLAPTKFYEGLDARVLPPSERSAMSSSARSVDYRTLASLVRKLVASTGGSKSPAPDPK